jgi:hypothetical protein
LLAPGHPRYRNFKSGNEVTRLLHRIEITFPAKTGHILDCRSLDVGLDKAAQSFFDGRSLC